MVDYKMALLDNADSIVGLFRAVLDRLIDEAIIRRANTSIPFIKSNLEIDCIKKNNNITIYWQNRDRILDYDIEITYISIYISLTYKDDSDIAEILADYAYFSIKGDYLQFDLKSFVNNIHIDLFSESNKQILSDRKTKDLEDKLIHIREILKNRKYYMSYLRSELERVLGDDNKHIIDDVFNLTLCIAITYNRINSETGRVYSDTINLDLISELKYDNNIQNIINIKENEDLPQHLDFLLNSIMPIKRITIQPCRTMVEIPHSDIINKALIDGKSEIRVLSKYLFTLGIENISDIMIFINESLSSDDKHKIEYIENILNTLDDMLVLFIDTMSKPILDNPDISTNKKKEFITNKAQLEINDIKLYHIDPTDDTVMVKHRQDLLNIVNGSQQNIKELMFINIPFIEARMYIPYHRHADMMELLAQYVDNLDYMHIVNYELVIRIADISNDIYVSINEKKEQKDLLEYNINLIRGLYDTIFDNSLDVDNYLYEMIKSGVSDFSNNISSVSVYLLFDSVEYKFQNIIDDINNIESISHQELNTTKYTLSHQELNDMIVRIKCYTAEDYSLNVINNYMSSIRFKPFKSVDSDYEYSLDRNYVLFDINEKSTQTTIMYNKEWLELTHKELFNNVNNVNDYILDKINSESPHIGYKIIRTILYIVTENGNIIPYNFELSNIRNYTKPITNSHKMVNLRLDVSHALNQNEINELVEILTNWGFIFSGTINEPMNSTSIFTTNTDDIALSLNESHDKSTIYNKNIELIEAIRATSFNNTDNVNYYICDKIAEYITETRGNIAATVLFTFNWSIIPYSNLITATGDISTDNKIQEILNAQELSSISINIHYEKLDRQILDKIHTLMKDWGFILSYVVNDKRLVFNMFIEDVDDMKITLAMNENNEEILAYNIEQVEAIKETSFENRNDATQFLYEKIIAAIPSFNGKITPDVVLVFGIPIKYKDVIEFIDNYNRGNIITNNSVFYCMRAYKLSNIRIDTFIPRDIHNKQIIELIEFMSSIGFTVLYKNDGRIWFELNKNDIENIMMSVNENKNKLSETEFNEKLYRIENIARNIIDTYGTKKEISLFISDYIRKHTPSINSDIRYKIRGFHMNFSNNEEDFSVFPDYIVQAIEDIKSFGITRGLAYEIIQKAEFVSVSFIMKYVQNMTLDIFKDIILTLSSIGFKFKGDIDTFEYNNSKEEYVFENAIGEYMLSLHEQRKTITDDASGILTELFNKNMNFELFKDIKYSVYEIDLNILEYNINLLENVFLSVSNSDIEDNLNSIISDTFKNVEILSFVFYISDKFYKNRTYELPYYDVINILETNKRGKETGIIDINITHQGLLGRYQPLIFKGVKAKSYYSREITVDENQLILDKLSSNGFTKLLPIKVRTSWAGNEEFKITGISYEKLIEKDISDIMLNINENKKKNHLLNENIEHIKQVYQLIDRLEISNDINSICNITFSNVYVRDYIFTTNDNELVISHIDIKRIISNEIDFADYLDLLNINKYIINRIDIYTTISHKFLYNMDASEEIKKLADNKYIIENAGEIARLDDMAFVIISKKMDISDIMLSINENKMDKTIYDINKHHFTEIYNSINQKSIIEDINRITNNILSELKIEYFIFEETIKYDDNDSIAYVSMGDMYKMVNGKYMELEGYFLRRISSFNYRFIGLYFTSHLSESMGDIDKDELMNMDDIKKLISNGYELVGVDYLPNISNNIVTTIDFKYLYIEDFNDVLLSLHENKSMLNSIIDEYASPRIITEYIENILAKSIPNIKNKKFIFKPIVEFFQYNFADDIMLNTFSLLHYNGTATITDLESITAVIFWKSDLQLPEQQEILSDMEKILIDNGFRIKYMAINRFKVEFDVIDLVNKILISINENKESGRNK